MYVYICRLRVTYVCIYNLIRTLTPVCVENGMNRYIDKRKYTCYTHTNTYVDMHAYEHTYIYIYIHIYVPTCLVFPTFSGLTFPVC